MKIRTTCPTGPLTSSFDSYIFGLPLVPAPEYLRGITSKFVSMSLFARRSAVPIWAVITAIEYVSAEVFELECNT